MPSQCGSTLTVEELIELLEDHEGGRPVYMRIDNGYTYGSISYGDIATAEDVGEIEEDLEE